MFRLFNPSRIPRDLDAIMKTQAELQVAISEVKTAVKGAEDRTVLAISGLKSKVDSLTKQVADAGGFPDDFVDQLRGIKSDVDAIAVDSTPTPTPAPAPEIPTSD